MKQVKDKDQANPEVAQVAGIQAIFSLELTCVGRLLASSPEPPPHSHHCQSQNMASYGGRQGKPLPGPGHPAQ